MVAASRVRRLIRSRIGGWVALGVGVAVAATGLVAIIDGGDADLVADPDDRRFVEEFALAVTTFDARRVDADIDRILGFGTSDFAADFRASMGDTFVEDLRASGASSIGEIVAGPTIQRSDDSTAVYFVVVNQRIIAPSSPAPESGNDGQQDPTASTSSTAPTPESRVIRVGLLVQFDRNADLVSSVEVL